MSTELAESDWYRKHIAEEIRALLGRREMSRIELARRVGRSHTYLWRRLTGEYAFDVDDLRNIAAVLGVSIMDLLPKVDVTDGQRTRQYLPGERVIATVGAKANTTTPAIPQRRTRQHRRPSVGGSIRPLATVGR